MSEVGSLTATEKQVHLGRTAYKTQSVASQKKKTKKKTKKLEGTGITRKGNPNSQVPAPPFTMLARRRQCTHRPTITPNKHALQIFTDTSKKGGALTQTSTLQEEPGPFWKASCI